MTTPNNLWDDQEMADLVGLHLPEPAATEEQAADYPVAPTVAASDPEPLLDAEDIDGQALRDRKPKLSLAANPFTKLGVVAAGTGLVIGVLAVFTSGVMKNDSPPAEEVQADFPDPMVEETEVSATDDRGQLLTDLAMGRQQAELEALANEEPTAQPEAPTAREAPEFSPAPPPPARPPQPVAARPAPAPLPPRPAPVSPAVSARPIVSQPVAQPVIDPTERWLALSHLGSYGQGSPLAQEPSAPLVTAAPTPVPASVAQVSTPPPSRNINHAEETAILQGQPVALLPTSPLLLTGTQAPAVLETPLIWAAETDSPQFVVQLTEPLLTANGEIGLPADTSLVAQVTSVADSGLAQLAVVSFIQAGQEIPLSAGAVQLRGVEGTPLIAQKYDDPGMDIARMDATMAAMAGLSRAAGLVNRPKTSSVITSVGSSAITQDTGEPNLLAGILEGAFEQLSGQMEARNQAALDEILNRPVVWYLPPGTEVDVYVNQTVAL
ncbi:TrbI/VirB10 family protein [Nodosilinea sp. LEGE 07088]|uniref:TrbI/VirB10 family protein n=1 Tax=Nodosilinea sp. LEGE 07088 TaxID=2777968 RepID=UPI001882246F|nr:TrbI/VirB10 family protein [Nodosilinea sp. LEGE 07088]MBE9135719.1 TrbI/VirB10 family protein [Nodosilinea sp. LEGE 07088]